MSRQPVLRPVRPYAPILCRVRTRPAYAEPVPKKGTRFDRTCPIPGLTCYQLLHSLLEFQPELWGLPPFDDRLDNTLPIEPIHVSGVYVNGALHESTQNATVALSGQVFGLYFGWAKVHTDMNFKNICLIDSNSDHMYEQQRMQIHLVGYIRAFDNKELTSKELEKLEGYKSTARAFHLITLVRRRSEWLLLWMKKRCFSNHMFFTSFVGH
ncbi:hypothetical protein PIB30_090017 [Stylosanthes scabra]|uniref:Uncharacterized protein n=1 Tax=Stylosanthes scabra TaxID=79078 RepID=A0ABU6ZTG4_9FABA|nr:hypothetical protein [Stylosanthes scabra]